MGFWIFMLAIGLLIPAIMIVFGRLFMRSAPKKINCVFGFRTDMSMKNKDTWEFAHKHIGKLWVRLGSLLLPVTVIPMLFVIGGAEGIVATVGLIVNFVNVIVLVVPAFFTEKALNRVFDKDGNRKASIQDASVVPSYTYATNKVQEQAAAKMGNLLKQAL